MSKVYFRNIEKEDLNQVFVLLNQLKPMENQYFSISGGGEGGQNII